jgi:hypothetical protein
MLEELRETMAGPLAHVLERVHGMCGAVVKDKKNTGCPPKLLLPLKALHGCLVVFPALQPAWPLSRSIEMVAGLTQHNSESVRQQAELALLRLLLTSFPLAGEGERSGDYGVCVDRPHQNSGGAQWSGKGGKGVDMSVAVEILRAVAVVGMATVDGERERGDAVRERAAELLLSLALHLNEIANVAAGSACSVLVSGGRGDGAAGDGGEEGEWNDVVEAFAVLCLCQNAVPLRVTGLKILWLISKWTEGDPSNITHQSVYAAAAADISKYAAQGRVRMVGSGGGGGVAKESLGMAMARVPAAITRPREAWHISSSAARNPQSASNSPLPSNPSLVTSDSLACNTWAQGQGGEGERVEEEGNENLLFVSVFGDGNESDVIRGEILFDMLQRLAVSRPVFVALLARCCWVRVGLVQTELGSAGTGSFKIGDPSSSSPNFFLEWLPLVSVALSSTCAPAMSLYRGAGCDGGKETPGEGGGGMGGEKSGGGGTISVEGLIDVLGSHLRESCNESCVLAAAIVLGKVLATRISCSSPLAELIFKQLAPLENGGGGSKTFSSMLGAKKHACRALIRRLTVLTIAADTEPLPSRPGTALVAGKGGEGEGGGLLSKLLELAAEVVDYFAYFESKYAKKDGRVEGEKEEKRQTLQRHFLHFIITAAPHLNRCAPAVAWTPATRSRVFDAVVPQLHLARCLFPGNDASTHSSYSEKSIHSAIGSTHGGGGGGGGGEEEWSLKALRAMAVLQSGPAITMSSSALHLLGLPSATAVQGEGMRLLELWIDKALISYQGEWLESSRDFLYNFLVGNTQAVTWSLDCCYSSNKELAHSHFLVLSRLLASHSVSNCPPEEAMLVALYMLGDPAQHIRQRAAQLLSFALARASRAHPGHQSLPEVSGTEYLNPLRLDALQLRASEKSADFAAAFCVGGMQAKTMSALFARVLNAPCASQQRILLSLSLPWLERLDLSAANRTEGVGVGGGGSECVMVAEMLHLTRNVSAVLPDQVRAMWTALGSKNRNNVEVCIMCFVSITQCLLSAPDLPLQSLAALELATDGIARGARVPAMTLLSSILESQVRQLVAGSVDCGGISPAVLLGPGGFNGVVKGEGGLYQAPADEDFLAPDAEVGGRRGGWEGEAGGELGGQGVGMLASERDAALVLLSSSLDSLQRVTNPEHLACLSAHASAILHASVMSCAGMATASASRAPQHAWVTATADLPAGKHALSGGVRGREAERVISESCKGLMVLVLRLLSSAPRRSLQVSFSGVCVRVRYVCVNACDARACAPVYMAFSCKRVLCTAVCTPARRLIRGRAGRRRHSATKMPSRMRKTAQGRGWRRWTRTQARRRR